VASSSRAGIDEWVRALRDVAPSDRWIDPRELMPMFERWAHPEVEWREDPNWPGSGTYRGLEEIRENVIEDHWESFDFEFNLEELIAAGDQVLVICRVRGRGKGSGAEAEMTLDQLYTFSEGRILSVRFYMDRAEARRAAGAEATPT
jgi:ketosteroid isomerase-like protein